MTFSLRNNYKEAGGKAFGRTRLGALERVPIILAYFSRINNV